MTGITPVRYIILKSFFLIAALCGVAEEFGMNIDLKTNKVGKWHTMNTCALLQNDCNKGFCKVKKIQKS